MYAESTLKKYTEDLASKLPAPGGGSAAAYCGALGAAAMEMVCSFTVDNDKYKSVHGAFLLGRRRLPWQDEYKIDRYLRKGGTGSRREEYNDSAGD